MPKLACCDGSITIRQVDSAKPSALPYPIHKAQSDVTSLACRADKEFALAWGTGGNELRQTKGPTTEIKLYEHSHQMWHVRVRSVARTDRVYFSAPRVGTMPLLIDIFMLKGGSVSLYTTINPKHLTFPHPYNPDEDAYAYTGDFVFGDGDVLYLSTGNWSGFKVGMYRILGAGPDKVTGTIERIYLGEGPIQALCFEKPKTLYFMRELGSVWKLDLSTMTETFEVDIHLPQSSKALDITLAGTGFVPLWYWYVLSAWKKFFADGAAAIWGLAEALLGTPRRRSAG